MKALDIVKKGSDSYAIVDKNRDSELAVVQIADGNKVSIDELRKLLTRTPRKKETTKKKARKKTDYNRLESIDIKGNGRYVYAKCATGTFYWDMADMHLHHENGDRFTDTDYHKRVRVHVGAFRDTIRKLEEEYNWLKVLSDAAKNIANRYSPAVSMENNLALIFRRIHSSLENVSMMHAVEKIAKSGLFVDIHQPRHLIHDIHGKNPSEILGIPKEFVNLIRSGECQSDINELQSCARNGLVNFYFAYLEKYGRPPLARQHGYNEMVDLDVAGELVTEYGYKPEALVDYIERALPAQGLNRRSLSTLRDYVRMCTHVGEDYIRYPKYLRSVHDRVAVKYKIKENETINKLYQKRKVENLHEKKFSFKRGKYIVTVPDCIDELEIEGCTLGHCVASYAENVSRGRTVIVFAREKEAPDVPLVTIEVRNFNIVQYQGARGVKMPDDLRIFIEEYRAFLWKQHEKFSH